jgi:hypothetical protein
VLYFLKALLGNFHIRCTTVSDGLVVVGTSVITNATSLYPIELVIGLREGCYVLIMTNNIEGLKTRIARDMPFVDEGMLKKDLGGTKRFCAMFFDSVRYLAPCCVQ